MPPRVRPGGGAADRRQRGAASSSLRRPRALLLCAAAAAACFLGAARQPAAWVVQGGSRREALLAVGAGVAALQQPEGALAASFLPQDLGSGQPATVKKKKVAEDKLLESVYLISRVQEATVQQERLVSTGKFKDAQRNNINMAINMMLDNYKLNDCIVTASANLPAEKSFAASQLGRDAVDALETAKEYFGLSKLKVSGLTDEQRTFVKTAMLTTRQKLDKFLEFVPDDIVQQARRQVEEENEANAREFVSEGGDTAMLNPVTLPWKKA